MAKNKVGEHIINVQPIDQRTDTRKLLTSGIESDDVDRRWNRYTCAICSLKMALSALDSRMQKEPIMKLTREAEALNGYDVKHGWRHDALTGLAKKYGFKIFRMFPKTKEYRKRGLATIKKNILKGYPVIASIYFKLNSTKGGHMIVINGIKIGEDGKVEGYYIVDPDTGFKGNKYSLTARDFEHNWRGGLIYFLE